ncbi:MAG: hypothetical protein M8861_05070 [marine benthic group bacterium]|nr:hypothetical protein [Gemmatimonadota bacterium]
MIRIRAAAIRLAACVVMIPGTAAAQYTITAENGDTVQFESAALRTMLDTARALWKDLDEDPDVLYYTPAGRQPVPAEAPDAAYPWNAVTVVDDSTIDSSRLPANLREADRAYYNYAVQRMRVVRWGDPDVSCDSLLAQEEKVVGSFIDGWILSRSLFGAPAFEPLDELVFARRAGLLRPLLARRNDPQVGACAGQWADANPERIAAYETWRLEKFPLPGEGLEEGQEEEPTPGRDEAEQEPAPDDPEGSRPSDPEAGRDR